LYLCGFLIPLLDVDFRADFVANCFLGALPPVLFLAVCLVLAIFSFYLSMSTVYRLLTPALRIFFRLCYFHFFLCRFSVTFIFFSLFCILLLFLSPVYPVFFSSFYCGDPTDFAQAAVTLHAKGFDILCEADLAG